MSYKKELDQLKLLTEQNAAEKQVFTQLNETYRRRGKGCCNLHQVTVHEYLAQHWWLKSEEKLS